MTEERKKLEIFGTAEAILKLEKELAEVSEVAEEGVKKD